MQGCALFGRVCQEKELMPMVAEEHLAAIKSDDLTQLCVWRPRKICFGKIF
jgi:hypothetical protein